MPIQFLNINNSSNINTSQITNLNNSGNTLMSITPPGIGGSIFFNGTTTSRITTSGSTDATLQLGTGSFTVEWWQNLSAGVSSFPRVFEQSSNLMVSIEGSNASRTFYVWSNTSFTSFGSITSSLNETWNHFAVVRSGSGTGNVKVYRNGVQLGSAGTISTNFNSTNAINIGNRTTGFAASEAFSGSITNFHWIKGVAKYTASFTPTGPLTPISGSTGLLLLASSQATLNTDSSGYNRTMINTTASFNFSNPF